MVKSRRGITRGEHQMRFLSVPLSEDGQFPETRDNGQIAESAESLSPDQLGLMEESLSEGGRGRTEEDESEGLSEDDKERRQSHWDHGDIGLECGSDIQHCRWTLQVFI
ncbi:hypothetical protein PENTCL1PPCAC_30701 [Pristionchus entomophagus]|uniref:Uncharacterized protein n=1 Tax=Pristionchus entomophagus TaxID=358040 RepID=A0AAV5T3B9_9BILA|nr:hypothetical protein PENTCL1PPCAC_10864 [Pristionchus entomophagus]GMT08527.1 hypothetical protein PENTCL1PPCAC_30701 [Pristionchus entomophagus]